MKAVGPRAIPISRFEPARVPNPPIGAPICEPAKGELVTSDAASGEFIGLVAMALATAVETAALSRIAIGMSAGKPSPTSVPSPLALSIERDSSSSNRNRLPRFFNPFGKHFNAPVTRVCKTTLQRQCQFA